MTTCEVGLTEKESLLLVRLLANAVEGKDDYLGPDEVKTAQQIIFKFSLAGVFKAVPEYLIPKINIGGERK